MRLPLYDKTGEKKGSVKVPDALFEEKNNPALLWQAVYVAQSRRRRPTAHTKNRGEVRGGGRKPWRQKGTGFARHGSRRSPLWVGGGVTFGPTKERNYTKILPKKMRRKALAVALSQKAREGDILAAETLSLEPPKTGAANKFVQALLGPGSFTLAVYGDKDEGGFGRIFRNLKRTKAAYIENINILDILNNRYCIFSKKALETLTQPYGSISLSLVRPSAGRPKEKRKEGSKKAAATAGG